MVTGSETSPVIIGYWSRSQRARYPVEHRAIFRSDQKCRGENSHYVHFSTDHVGIDPRGVVDQTAKRAVQSQGDFFSLWRHSTRVRRRVECLVQMET